MQTFAAVGAGGGERHLSSFLSPRFKTSKWGIRRYRFKKLSKSNAQDTRDFIQRIHAWVFVTAFDTAKV